MTVRLSLIPVAILGAIGTVVAPEGLSKAPVTLEAAVERAHFVPSELAVSPDGYRVAYVIVRPQLSTNQNAWSLNIIELEDHRRDAVDKNVFETLSPAYLDNSATTRVNAPISRIKWLNDHHSVLFKRQSAWDSDASEICVLNVDSRQLRVVYSFAGDVSDISTSADGNIAALHLVYPQDAGKKLEMEENGFSINKRLFIPRLTVGLWQNPRQQIVVIRGLLTEKPSSDLIEQYGEELLPTSGYTPHLSLSPDGRFLVYVRELDALPEAWEHIRRYQGEFGAMRSFVRPYDFGLNQALTIYGVGKRTKRIAFNHPNTKFEAVAWSDDSARFAVRAPPPLPPTSTRNKAQGTRVDLYAVDVAQLTSTRISGRDVSAESEILAWTHRGGRLVLRSDTTQIRTLNFEHRQWRAGSVVNLLLEHAPYWTGEIRVASDAVVARLESSSVAPELYLWRTGLEGSHPIQLTDTAFQLTGLEFGAVQKVYWKNQYGAACVGYLIMPPRYDPHTKYPAVIMLKDWQDSFIMDGQSYSTAFPVQPLANDGFIVLMAAAPDPEQEPNVPPGKMGYVFNELAMVESGIDLLKARTSVDPQRIGIAGFSATSWQTQFILTHSTFPFAAASTAESSLNYVQYAIANLHDASQGFDMSSSDQLFGGPPFGRTLKNWLDHGPAFNTARVRAPVLTEACGDSIVSAPAFEWFTGLHKLGKPVEFYMYPNGQHQLQRPRERLASLRINTDWFRFWLQRYEGEPPSYDPDRYMRWRQLRIQQETNERALLSGKDPAEE